MVVLLVWLGRVQRGLPAGTDGSLHPVTSGAAAGLAPARGAA
jgi:hypothetical protein